jgi:hypothetical protein
MPHRAGWRHRDRGRETPSHLSADRLSDIVRALPSQPSESFEPSEPSESSQHCESSVSLESLPFSESTGPLRSVRALRVVRRSQAHESSQHSESLGASECSDPSGSYEPDGMRAPRRALQRTLMTRPSHLWGSRVRPLDGPENAVALTADSRRVGESLIVASRTGRHRRPPSARLSVWTRAFTSGRLALIALPALLVVGVMALLAVR